MSFENSTAEEIQDAYEAEYRRFRKKYFPLISILPFVLINAFSYYLSILSGKPLTITIFCYGVMISLMITFLFYSWFFVDRKPGKDDGLKMRQLLDAQEKRE